MRIFFKSLSLVLLALCVGVFSAVAYGTADIPDEFNITASDTVELEAPFGIRTQYEMARTAATLGEGDGCGEHKAQVVALGAFPVKTVTVNVTKRKYVNVGGDVFGIKLYTQGVIVVGIEGVTTNSGSSSPGENAGVKKGDVIVSVNSEALNSAEKLAQMVEASKGKPLLLELMRGKAKHRLSLTPLLAADGKYKAGLWVRDSSAGIGTITFSSGEGGVFAGLGHAVCDIDTGEIMPLSQGEAVMAQVVGCYRGAPGNPGELCGTFTKDVIGSLVANNPAGVFGIADNASPAKGAQLPVALENEIKTGKAQIIATVDENGPQYYDIEITKIYSSVDSTNRNMVVKVTDSVLLEKTGGIVQGMSGSPIIQNSMLVGAVTHVFINDPTQGYAIFAGKMLAAIDSIQSSPLKKAS